MEEEHQCNNNNNYAMKDIVEPGINDVLLGRGAGTNRHPGNIYFRNVVKDYQSKYINAINNHRKYLITMDIIQKIRDLPGRFIIQDSLSDLWYDVGDEKARRKISQALRENAPELRGENHDNVTSISISANSKTTANDNNPQKGSIAIKENSDGGQINQVGNLLNKQNSISFLDDYNTKNNSTSNRNNNKKTIMCNNSSSQHYQNQQKHQIMSIQKLEETMEQLSSGNLNVKDVELMLKDIKSNSIIQRRDSSNISILKESLRSFNIDDNDDDNNNDSMMSFASVGNLSSSQIQALSLFFQLEQHLY